MNKAAHTRNYILENAFSLIYKNGFQATSIDGILENTKVTKGAFYYHFKNKDEMGVAIVQDIVWPEIQKTLLQPLAEYNNPLNAIYQSIKTHILSLSDKQIKYGCPATNLIMELPPLSDAFKIPLQALLDHWQAAVENNLQMAKEKQLISPDTDIHQAATFVIASYQGARTMGKLHVSREGFHAYLAQLDVFLQSL